MRIAFFYALILRGIGLVAARLARPASRVFGPLSRIIGLVCLLFIGNHYLCVYDEWGEGGLRRSEQRAVLIVRGLRQSEQRAVLVVRGLRLPAWQAVLAFRGLELTEWHAVLENLA